MQLDHFHQKHDPLGRVQIFDGSTLRYEFEQSDRERRSVRLNSAILSVRFGTYKYQRIIFLPMNSQKIDVYLDDGGAFPAGLDMVMILSSAERRVLCYCCQVQRR